MRTIDLVLVAAVHDRVQLLEHPLAERLGADVVDVQQVDAHQRVEQLALGEVAGLVERLAQLAEQARQRVDRDRRPLFSATCDTSIASVVLPVPTSPISHSPRPRSRCAVNVVDEPAHLAHDRESISDTGGRSNDTPR